MLGRAYVVTALALSVTLAGFCLWGDWETLWPLAVMHMFIAGALLVAYLRPLDSEALLAALDSDRDGAEGGDANAAPVPQDRQARAEGIAHPEGLSSPTMTEGVRLAAQALCDFAWSSLTADSEESKAYLNNLVADLREALSTPPSTVRDDELRAALHPEILEAIADEIDCFEHSARAASLRIVAKQQRAALSNPTRDPR